MIERLSSYLTLSSMITCCFIAAPSAAESPPDEQARRVLDQFIQSVEANRTYLESAKEFVKREWQQRRTKGDYESFIPEALAVLQPRFKTGLDAFQAGEFEYCAKIMGEMSLNSDPYLAAHAALFQAKALVQELQLEFADLLLAHYLREDFNLGEYCFYVAQMRFLQGYCRFHTFDSAGAKEAFGIFLRDHPQATPELRATAERLLEELQSPPRKNLGLVSHLMADAGLSLTEGESGMIAQTRQWKAMLILEELIRKAQEQEQQQCQQQQQQQGAGQGQGQQPPRGAAAPQSPAQQSSAPGGEATMGMKHNSPPASPSEVWGQMKPQERARIMQALQQNFPSRYRELVEQYYEELAKEK